MIQTVQKTKQRSKDLRRKYELHIFPSLLFSFLHCVPTRSEPSSRTTLIGEQPNLWELLHPQDVVSRHRGAELRRRYELLGGTSLLSLE